VHSATGSACSDNGSVATGAAAKNQ
jgi:hypothetical protein